MAEAIAGLMRCPAMQPHLPTEYTQQYTEEQQAAMLVGYNTRDSIQEVTAFGAKATATETQHKNSLYRGALTGEEAEHGQISQFSRFMQRWQLARGWQQCGRIGISPPRCRRHQRRASAGGPAGPRAGQGPEKNKQ